ncbi:helix-turn-helix domain-containing protein [Streptosporangium roseum]|uniref:helix-turn-helix domain-containing protein n=1 Tax=Streptosporangium roseum TaxID=2001 RepID=UPI0033234EDE
MEPLFYRPKDAAVMLGMSRTAVFRLIKSGELKSIKDEGYRLVPRWALHGSPVRWKPRRGSHRKRQRDGEEAGWPVLDLLRQ